MVEQVMPGRNRGMRSEHRSGRRGLQSRVEIKPHCNPFAAPLKNQEGGMPLIDVPDTRDQTQPPKRQNTPTPSSSSWAIRMRRSPHRAGR